MERGIAVATMRTPLMNKPCLCELVVMVSLERERERERVQLVDNYIHESPQYSVVGVTIKGSQLHSKLCLKLMSKENNRPW